MQCNIIGQIRNDTHANADYTQTFSESSHEFESISVSHRDVWPRWQNFVVTVGGCPFYVGLI